MLSLIVPLLLIESGLLAAYFAGLKPDVITSCCGSLFSNESASFSGDLASLPHLPMQIAFFSGMAITTICGLKFYNRGCAGYLFSIAAAVTFLVACTSVISFIGLYFYELPTHHCPFCILQKEYNYVGYILYVTLFVGAVAGIGTGVLMPFRKVGSLARIIPVMQRRLTLVTLVCYLLFMLVVVREMMFSALKLGL